jgi:hypothetical protein
MNVELKQDLGALAFGQAQIFDNISILPIVSGWQAILRLRPYPSSKFFSAMVARPARTSRDRYLFAERDFDYADPPLVRPLSTKHSGGVSLGRVFSGARTTLALSTVVE